MVTEDVFSGLIKPALFKAVHEKRMSHSIVSCKRSVPLRTGLEKKQSGPLCLQSPRYAFRRYADTPTPVLCDCASAALGTMQATAPT
jgi:hypothetical protein